MRSAARSVIAVVFALAVAACGAEATAKPPEAPATCDRVSDDVKTAGRTVGAAAKTGAVAAADGVVQVGSATAGLVEDGTDGARARWKARAAETKRDARENADETKREANRPTCK